MKPALQQRAEIHLLHLIEMERSRRSAPRKPPWQKARVSYDEGSEEAQRGELARFRFGVDALAAIGALEESETEDWTARFEAQREAKERRPQVVPDPTTERRARALLEKVLPPSGLDPTSEPYEKAIWRFQEAQAAINISGALSQVERAHWQKRFLGRVSPEDRKRLHNSPRCTALDLQRVIPGPQSRHDGRRITHIELYGDGLVVHWHDSIAFQEPPGHELTSWERFRASVPGMTFDLSDDAGTAYRWWPGPSHDAVFRKDGFVHWASASFAPAVPAEATRLYASHEGNVFEIPLAA